MTLQMARDILTRSDQLVSSMLFDRELDTFMGAVIDSRSECHGKLFFALRGEHTDGHRFSMEAVRRGSAAVVIAREESAREAAASSTPYFMVREPLTALQELSREYRTGLPARVVAVTGSSGKTTTKELIRSALASKFRVQSNPGNFNNHIGVPLTILNTAPHNDLLVSEVGANHPGEIAFLCDLLRPDTAVITNIGDAHVGYFGGREAIARAKAELLDSLPPSGYAVLPGDDDYLELLRARSRGTAVTFGFSEACDYRISEYRQKETGAEFRVNGHPVAMRLSGRHNALNAAAALAVSRIEDIEWRAAIAALATVEPLEGRGKIVHGGGITLIDDAYNANPSSMRASLTLLAGISGRRRVAILGDMKELGDYSDRLHEELGREIAAMDVDLVWWLGDAADRVRSGMESAGGTARFRPFSELDAMIAAAGEIGPGDAVLVKGSHSCRLDRFVAALMTRIEKAGKS